MGNDAVESPSEQEQELVGNQLIAYYDWLSGQGGTDPDVLLAYPHTIAQRKLLLARMDDLNVIMGHLSALRPAVARVMEASSWNEGEME
jgi:hypothetical protein